MDCLDVQGIVAEQAAGKGVMDLRLDCARAIEGLAKSDHACISVDAHPDDVGEFLGAQSLDRRDLHGNNPPLTGAWRPSCYHCAPRCGEQADVLRLLVI